MAGNLRGTEGERIMGEVGSWKRKRLLYALLWGLGITVFSCWQMFNQSLVYPDILDWLARCLLMPGGILAVVVAGGNVHTYLRSVVVLGNLAFYAGLSYALLGIGRKRA
jgi:hypothetical protein